MELGLPLVPKKSYGETSVKGSPETMTLGFLTPEILTGPKMYRYNNGKTAMADSKMYTYKENGKTYTEYMIVLYMDDDRKDKNDLTNADKSYFTNQDHYKEKTSVCLDTQAILSIPRFLLPIPGIRAMQRHGQKSVSYRGIFDAQNAPLMNDGLNCGTGMAQAKYPFFI
ncbi:MAG: hypothetical protein FJX00_02290 [Alphaproteobacteria bacterium]|nr:hypothetical protein [Alphaproteobacteria bacterium]